MRKRNCRVEIYFTKTELENLTKKVRKSGLSREGYCRRILNGAVVKEAPPAELPLLIREVRRVGYNIEIYFPMKNVRYIAVNDCVDTANKNNDIAALKNVMNEFYSRDNSRKIRSSIRARAKAGLYRCSYAPLGYRKAPDNHNKLIVDEETAWIIKRIFEYANAGMGSHKIASTLRKEQVPCPSWWQYTRGEKDYSQRFSDPANKFEWSHTVIRGIIGNPVYLGHTIMCKHETVFKVGILKKTPDADRIRVENTHEPLVSQEIFDNANAKILSRKREDTSGNVSIFSGLIKCGTCGKAMCQRYWGRDRHHIFVCTTYAKNTQRCTDHRIFYDDLYDAVLADIQYHAQLAYEDRDKAVALAIRMNDKAEGSRAKSSEGKLKQARKRYDEVTRMFDRLYPGVSPTTTLPGWWISIRRSRPSFWSRSTRWNGPCRRSGTPGRTPYSGST